MKRFLTVLLTLIMLFVLSSCEALIERDFDWEEPHETHSDQTIFPDDGITDYYELKTAITNLVHTGISERIFRIAEYSGSLDEDLQKITAELNEQDPLAAYAVSTIVYEQSHVLSYQEVRVSIRYDKTAEERNSIIPVISTQDFERKTQLLLKTYPEKILYSFEYYNAI